jgi:hypothetical protein
MGANGHAACWCKEHPKENVILVIFLCEVKEINFYYYLGGYKAAILLWTKKEQELHEAGIPDCHTPVLRR